MVSILKIYAISLQSFSVFVRHGYLLDAAAEFLRHGSLSYQVYLYPDYMPIFDSIIYGYNCILQIAGPGKRNRAHETELTALNEEAV